MSRIDELVERLCPDGVDYKRFDEVCSLKARIGWQRLTKNEQQPSGDYMLIMGTDFTGAHRINYESCVYVSKERFDQDKNIQLRDGDVLITKDGTLGKVAVVENLPMPATLNGGVFVVRDISGKLNNRFIMHYLLSGFFSRTVEQQSTGSTISHLTQKLFSRLLIPVPPMEVQEEVVRVLDSFTELEAELEVELEARRRQYAHYRDELLDFAGRTDVRWMKLGIISSFRRGSFPQPYGRAEWYGGEEAMPFVQVADIGENMRLSPTTKRMISKIAQPKSVFAPKGTVLVSLQGSIGRVAISQYDAYIDRTVAIFTGIEPIVDKKYFSYQLQRIFAQKETTARGTTIKTITKEEFTHFTIPVPPLEEQERIVAILDKFDALVNDISRGIPAEIEARRKQYAYYRDKLLSFEEKAA